MKSIKITLTYYFFAFTIAIFTLSSCATSQPVIKQSKPNIYHMNEGEYIKSKQVK